MRVTITSRFTASIILVVITTVKERYRCVVAILLLHSNATSVGILIRHWMEKATKVLVVAFTFALIIMHEKTVGSQAVTCRHFCLKWSKIVTGMSTSYVSHDVSSRPKEGAKEILRPCDRPIDIGLAIGYR